MNSFCNYSFERVNHHNHKTGHKVRFLIFNFHIRLKFNLCGCPSGVVAMITCDFEFLTLSTIPTGGIVMASATSNTSTFTNSNFVSFTPFTSSFTSVSFQRFGYITLTNGYKYAPCVFQSSNAIAVTATVDAASKFVITY